MKLLITADLHYDVRRSKAAVESLAGRVSGTPADALVLVGDTAGADLDVFRSCLHLFAGFSGKKLLIPGNHCLWCHSEETSIQRYETLIPAMAEEEGFSVLDHAPVQLGSTALVGSVGWYDYTLRDESLGIPLEFYREKLSPGAARYYGGYDALLEQYADVLGERQLSLGARWMDGWRCRLGASDEEFLQRLMHTLETQLNEASRSAERIVVFLHHLPFGELIPQNRPDKFAFAAAYMGSENIGLLLKRYDKITDVYCAHSHWPSRCRVGNMNVVNVGSTYLHKNLEELDVC